VIKREEFHKLYHTTGDATFFFQSLRVTFSKLVLVVASFSGLLPPAVRRTNVGIRLPTPSMSMTMSTKPLFLGLDLSTQQLKAILLSQDSVIVHEASVHFDRDLPHYGTVNGAIRGPDPGEVTSPIEMWLEAVDLLFQRLKTDQVDFGAIAAISGAGQVHYPLIRSSRLFILLYFTATWLGVLVKQSYFLPIQFGF